VKTKLLAASAAIAITGTFAAGPAVADDHVKIAGSSTVLPYAKIVVEEFANAYPKLKAPVVEGGGSSAGLKSFCEGLQTIDIANSSRKIKDAEVKTCNDNGVKDVMEVRFGYDGIVFAYDIGGPEKANMTPKELFEALGAKVVKDGKLVDNTHQKWNEINPAFPAWDIVAYIPGEKHGTREVFETKTIQAGCKAAGAFDLYLAETKAKEPDEKKAKEAAEKACNKVRKDDAGKHAVDIDGDYTETLARLQSNKQGLGVFGLSFYQNNTDKLRVATIDGVEPSVETVSTGKYPVSRPLFFYVKKALMATTPGLKEYVEFFTSEKMLSSDGPLSAYGLVPLPEAEFKQLQADIKAQKTM
jgi:phosphate transport system substrate-binding protein